MSLRHQEFQDSCGLCDQLATARCARCDVPLCAAHAPSAELRCTDCEGELYVEGAKVGRIKGALVTLGVAAGSAVGAVAAFALGGWATTVIAGTMGIALSAFTASHVGTGSTSRRRRQKFLAERNPKYEPSIGEPEGPEGHGPDGPDGDSLAPGRDKPRN